MKYDKFLMSLLTILILFFSSVFVSGISITSNDIKNPIYYKNQENAIAKWTVMYYMCCDSNMQAYAEPLLENLSKIGSKNDFNLIALYDGVLSNDSKILHFDESGERINLNENIGWPSEVDTSNPVTMEEYVKDMMKYYPAEHYAVIYYGSAGTGWQVFCVHDTYGTQNNTIKKGNIGFSTPRLGEAFKNITKNGEEKIDVIYTSCAMNTIEMAYEVSPYVDYCLGTQDCLSSKIVYRYYESVWELYNNTDMNPEEFSAYTTEILNPISFYYHEEWFGEIRPLNKFFNKLSFKKLQTIKHFDNIGVINNSNINGLLCALDELSRFLIVNIQDEEIFDDITYARSKSRESSKCYAKPGSKLLSLLHYMYAFNFTAYNGVVDLYDFCEKLKEKTDNIFLEKYCEGILVNIDRTVPYIKKVENDPIHGLNIYFPSEKEIYNKYIISGEMPCTYEELALSKDTMWDEFVKAYLCI